MPSADSEVPTVAAEPILSEPAASPERADGSTRAAKRKLGLGGWICVGWLGFIVLLAIIAPLFVADPVMDGKVISQGCGTGDGLPLYDANKCSDLDAKKAQEAARTDDPQLREIKLARVKGSEFSHVAGVDQGGRDVFSRTLLGTRMTLIIAVVSVGIAVTIGGILGLISGYFRGRVDTAIAMGFDIMISFPALVLALLLVLLFAGEDPARRPFGIITALAIVATPILGRITRAATLNWSNREFVMASKAIGAKPFRVITREVLPNVAPAMMSIALLVVGIVVAAESSLSLIGLGIGGNDVSWGSVIAAGGNDFRNYYHLVFFPSIFVVLTVCSLNFLGDALRKKFDVRESAL